MRALHVVSFAVSVADQRESWTVRLHVLMGTPHLLCRGSQVMRLHRTTPGIFHGFVHSAQLWVVQCTQCTAA